MNAMLSRIHPFLQTVRRALSFVWESSPRLTVGSIIVRVIQGLLPLLVLYLTKLLIDAVTEGLKTPADESSMTHITTILGGLAGVAVASAILTVASSLISRIQSQVITDHMHALLQAKSVEVDLEYYENAQYQDTLHRAQQEAPYRPTAILNALLQFGQDAISLLAMMRHYSLRSTRCPGRATDRSSAGKRPRRNPSPCAPPRAPAQPARP